MEINETSYVVFLLYRADCALAYDCNATVVLF